MNIVLGCFMVSAGAITINTSFDYDTVAVTKLGDAGKAAGSFAVINAVFYFLDAHFARQNMVE